MRFFLYVSFIFAVLPLVFFRPFFGICIYYVVSLLQPKVLCWRPDFQDALLVGVPFVIGAIALGVKRVNIVPRTDPVTGAIEGAKTQLVRSPILAPSWIMGAFVLLVAYIAVARWFVFDPPENNSYEFKSLCKVLLVTFLMIGLASDFRRFRILFIVIALSTAFWAVKGGLKVILLGPHQVYGRTYDNNLFALTSVMTLPMVFYFGMGVEHAQWRTLLLVCSVLISLGIIGSRSRAGFVAFVFVVICMMWSSRYRLRAIFALLVVLSATILTSSSEIMARIHSIVAYQQDASAVSRFTTWEIAQELFRQSPIIGVGFNNFEMAKDRIYGGRKAAHNIFLQNISELGLLGHPLWLFIIVGTILSLFRLMRQSRGFPPDMRWAYYWSRGLLLGMMAYGIHGFFHNEEYLELMFAMVGLNVALHHVTRREIVARKLFAIEEKSKRNDGRATANTSHTGKPTRPIVPIGGTMLGTA